MLNNIKKNILFILSFLILFLFLCISVSSFVKERNTINNKNLEAQEFCKTLDYNTEYQSFCETVMSNENMKVDFYTALTNVLVFGLGRYVGIILFLFTIIPALFYVCKHFKYKQINNECTREEYGKSIKRVFKESYKTLFIIPTIVLIAIIFSILYTKNIDPTYAIYHSSTGWSEFTLHHFFLFSILYIVNTIIHSALYINIGLCIARKNHNYFVAVILSFLSIIGIEAILEIVFNGIICISLFKSDVGIMFNIVNMFAFNDVNGMGTALVIPTILMIGSFAMVYACYKNKEKFIIDCEKNE